MATVGVDFPLSSLIIFLTCSIAITVCRSVVVYDRQGTYLVPADALVDDGIQLFRRSARTNASSSSSAAIAAADIVAVPDDISGSLDDTLKEHMKKIRQTFNFLDLRPKETCSRRPGIHMFYCPTPNMRNLKEWSCIRIDELCNGIPDCHGAEDEDPTLCMFWLAGQEQLRVLKKIIVAHYHATVDSNAAAAAASSPYQYGENDN